MHISGLNEIQQVKHIPYYLFAWRLDLSYSLSYLQSVCHWENGEKQGQSQAQDRL